MLRRYKPVFVLNPQSLNRWNPAAIRRNRGRGWFFQRNLVRLCEFGPHFPKMVLVLNFPIAELVNDVDVYCGACLREPDFLLRDVTISDNAFAVQLLQGIHNLAKAAVELRECLINLWFHAVKYT